MRTLWPLLVVMFLPGWMLGQGTTITNQDKYIFLQISVDNVSLGMLNAKASKSFAAIPKDRNVTVEVSWLRNGAYQSMKFTKAAGVDQVVLDKDKDGKVFLANSSLASGPTPSPDLQKNIANPPSSRYTWAVLVDSTSHRIEIREGPFAGLALAPEQTSADSVMVPLGLNQWSAIFNMDENKSSTGKNYLRFVYSEIITQGQRRIVIREQNLLYTSTGKKKVKVVSQFPDTFVITGGPFAGVTLANGEYWSGEKDLVIGFNNSSLQCFKANGEKYQANWEIIVTQHRHLYFITLKNVKNESSSIGP